MYLKPAGCTIDYYGNITSNKVSYIFDKYDEYFEHYIMGLSSSYTYVFIVSGGKVIVNNLNLYKINDDFFLLRGDPILNNKNYEHIFLIVWMCFLNVCWEVTLTMSHWWEWSLTIHSFVFMRGDVDTSRRQPLWISIIKVAWVIKDVIFITSLINVYMRNYWIQ